MFEFSILLRVSSPAHLENQFACTHLIPRTVLTGIDIPSCLLSRLGQNILDSAGTFGRVGVRAWSCFSRVPSGGRSRPGHTSNGLVLDCLSWFVGGHGVWRGWNDVRAGNWTVRMMTVRMMVVSLQRGGSITSSELYSLIKRSVYVLYQALGPPSGNSKQ